MIPDVRNRLPFNPFEPKAAADLIARVGDYLADKVPASARVRVQNAHFVQVQARVGVRFIMPVGDVEFFKQRLVDELNHFLSPWAYEEGVDLVIGGRIYANSIVNFIAGRPHIDHVAHITLFTSEDGETFLPARDTDTMGGYYVATSRPDGVLVAARNHVIDLIGNVSVEEEEDSFKGINYWRIGLDFSVG